MILKTSCGILLVLSLLALVQLHFTASSGTGASEFSILPNSNTPCPMRPCYTLSQVMGQPPQITSLPIQPWCFLQGIMKLALKVS